MASGGNDPIKTIGDGTLRQRTESLSAYILNGHD